MISRIVIGVLLVFGILASCGAWRENQKVAAASRRIARLERAVDSLKALGSSQLETAARRRTVAQASEVRTRAADQTADAAVRASDSARAALRKLPAADVVARLAASEAQHQLDSLAIARLLSARIEGRITIQEYRASADTAILGGYTLKQAIGSTDTLTIVRAQEAEREERTAYRRGYRAGAKTVVVVALATKAALVLLELLGGR